MVADWEGKGVDFGKSSRPLHTTQLFETVVFIFSPSLFDGSGDVMALPPSLLGVEPLSSWEVLCSGDAGFEPGRADAPRERFLCFGVGSRVALFDQTSGAVDAEVFFVRTDEKIDMFGIFAVTGVC
jgi:hypothetical protein